MLEPIQGLCCPDCRGPLSAVEPSALICASCNAGAGKRYPVVDGIPMFAADAALGAQDRYIRRLYDLAALSYDVAIPALFPLLGVTEKRLRGEIIAAVAAPPGGRVLEVSVGTGANIPLLRAAAPGARICGLDLSPGMLRKCQRNFAAAGIRDVPLLCGNGSALPFLDDQFDVVFHVGGINSFGDKETALREMLRVVKPGGRVVLNDEGLSPERQKHRYSRIFIKAIFGLFASLERGETDPPMSSIPKEAVDVKLEFCGNGYFWLISFAKRSAPPN